MDEITIKDVEVFYRVGVPDEERAAPQRLSLTIVLERDLAAAGASDALEQTIDYGAIAVRVRGLGEQRSWKLIEAVAEDLAELILREFKPRRVTIEVKKFIIPRAGWVSVRVVRPGQ